MRQYRSKTFEWLRDVAVPYVGEDCLLFPFTTSAHGYGMVQAKAAKGEVHAHRVVKALHTGEAIPKGCVVRHTCDTPSCCCLLYTSPSPRD